MITMFLSIFQHTPYGSNDSVIRGMFLYILFALIPSIILSRDFKVNLSTESNRENRAA